MGAHHNIGAAAPCLTAPERPQKDEARELGGGAGIEVHGTADSPDFRGNTLAAQAALTIEGEAYARAYLDRLHADVAQPGELAVLLSFLTGEMLNGACRFIEKQLRGGHHA